MEDTMLPDKDEKRGKNRRRQIILYIGVAVCVFVAIIVTGTLSPGSAHAPVAQDPSIKVNETLFIEEFNSDVNNWIPDLDNEAYYENGELHLSCKTLNGSKPLWSSQPAEFNNVAFQVKAKKISGPDQQYGLIFGQPGGSFILFGITDSGYYGLMEWNSVEWLPLVNYTYSEYININGYNTLAVICKKAEEGYERQYVELHINGRYLTTAVTDTSADYKIGLYAGENDMHVAFDEFSVYDVD